MDGVCQPLCPAGQIAYPVNRCCVNGTNVNALGQCPGVIAPPLWYLEFLATGTGPCLLPSGNCSYYEFTIIGQQRFGRGSLTQRITLPPGSDFPEARITRGSKYCPASAWKCSKSGERLHLQRRRLRARARRPGGAADRGTRRPRSDAAAAGDDR